MRFREEGYIKLFCASPLGRNTFIFVAALSQRMGLFSRRGKTLYTPGPLAAARLPDVVNATRAVLRDMGIEVVELDLKSGFEAWYAGYEHEFQGLLRENKRVLAQHGITHIITNDPHEALTFRERYGIDARHVIEVCKEHISKIMKGDERRASYHHPCFLDKLGVGPNTAKSVLRRAGVHVPNENPSRGCCGSVGHDFERNNKEEADAIAKERSKALSERLVVTCCPHCLLLLRRYRKKVVDVVEILAEANR